MAFNSLAHMLPPYSWFKSYVFWLPAWWALWLLWWPLTDAAMFQCVYGYLQSVFFFLVLFHCCILLEIKLTTTTYQNWNYNHGGETVLEQLYICDKNTYMEARNVWKLQVVVPPAATSEMKLHHQITTGSIQNTLWHKKHTHQQSSLLTHYPVE